MVEDKIRVTVCNPGTHPELINLAARLSKWYDIRYLTSSNVARGSLKGIVLSKLVPKKWLIARQFRRRLLPVALRSNQVRLYASVRELLAYMSRRIAPSLTELLLSWRNRGYQRQVLRFHDRYRPRVIIAQYTAAREIFAAADSDALRILNYPIVHHAWLDRSMRDEGQRNPRWASLLQGHNLSPRDLALLDEEIELADVIVVPSTFAAQTFIDSGISSDKLVVIALGCEFIDSSEIQSAPVEPNPGFCVLYAGQVTQRKGVGYLVEAVEEMEGVRLELVGGSTPIARRLMSSFSRTDIYPSLPRDELLLRMRTASVLVLPSLAEGFGLVALEAMSVGCPVILSRQTFANDIIHDGENGFILPNVDKASIKSKLVEVMGTCDLDRIGREGARTAKTYSWDRYADEFASMLDELLGERN